MKELQNERIFYYFQEISNVPRGSGYNENIRDFLIDFAEKHKLSYEVDYANNVLIRKPASRGCEQCETVILQGHMDMVCVKKQDCHHDFKTEPLDIYTDGDFIKAHGTSLGGDDGVELAFALAILESDEYVHPPIEALFTTDEEWGFVGAGQFDIHKLKGKYIINIDSEEEDTICVGCAGAGNVKVTFPVQLDTVSGVEYQLTVSGLAGGHSGDSIAKSQDNASLLMFRILQGLPEDAYYIQSFFGGDTDNVIPSEANTVLIVKESERKLVEAAFQNVKKQIIDELQREQLLLVLKPSKQMVKCTVLAQELTGRIVKWANVLPNGVQKMSDQLEGFVETSLSLGCSCGNCEKIEFQTFIRSCVKSSIHYLVQKIETLATVFGGQSKLTEEHPVWQVKKDSKLTKTAAEVFEKQYGKKAKVGAIHAGLECSIFAEQCSGFDIISIGADTFDIHSVDERLSISSARRTFSFLLELLKRMTKEI